MDFFTYENPPTPWGDYGEILYYGLAEDTEEGLYIERVGEFAPHIYESCGKLLVADETKIKLENSGLKGFSFCKATIKKAVNLDWTSWDKNAESPAVYPKGGEPENYILKGKRDPLLAQKLPIFWKLVLNKTAVSGRKRDDKFRAELKKRNVVRYGNDNFLAEKLAAQREWEEVVYRREAFIVEHTWEGSDIFQTENGVRFFFTQKAKEWFEANYANCGVFEKINAQ
jgi:hypothetical protein